MTFGAAGFAAVAPDYLGLGKGPGAHPWKDVPSETSASLDMLRAARQFVPREGRILDGRVLATGFSQGASSALGLAGPCRRAPTRTSGFVPSPRSAAPTTSAAPSFRPC